MSKEKSAVTVATPKKAVVLYSVALFVVVVVFIAISYLINERGQDRFDELHEQQTTALQKLDTLRSDNEQLRFELSESETRVTELEAELAQSYTTWTEEKTRIENQHNTAYNDLLDEYNTLFAQFEELKETLITEDITG